MFDFETTGLEPGTPEAPGHTEVIQVAGKAYNARTLEPYPKEQGGEFESMMRVLHPERLDEERVKKALEVNRKTKEQILAAPEQSVVWNQFVQWVNRFNTSKGLFTAPIACGKNIRDFDMKFVHVLNHLHCKKGVNTLLFHRKQMVDLEEQMFPWFENDAELKNMKMDTLREYFSMSTDGAHDALVDVKQTGALIMRFIKLCRTLRERKTADGEPFIKMRGALAGVC